MTTNHPTCQCKDCENDNPIATRICGKCGKLVCDECFYGCEDCDSTCCCDCCHYHETGDGEQLLCDDCWNRKRNREKCAECGKEIPDGQQQVCTRCGRTVCGDCADKCAGCGEEFCLECLDQCVVCGRHLCREHKNFCDGCGEVVCTHHLVTMSDGNEYATKCLKNQWMKKEEEPEFEISIDDGGYHDSANTTVWQMQFNLICMLKEYLHSTVGPEDVNRWAMLETLAGTLIGRASERGLFSRTGIEVDFNKSDGLPLTIKPMD